MEPSPVKLSWNRYLLSSFRHPVPAVTSQHPEQPDVVRRHDGASPTRSGLLLIPLMLGVVFGSVGSGRIITATGRQLWARAVGEAEFENAKLKPERFAFLR